MIDIIKGRTMSDRQYYRLGNKNIIELKIYALRKGKSTSEVLEQIIQNYIKDKGKKIVLATAKKLESESSASEEQELSKKITVELDEAARAELQVIAEKLHNSVEGLLRLIIEDHLEETGVRLTITRKP